MDRNTSKVIRAMRMEQKATRASLRKEIVDVASDMLRNMRKKDADMIEGVHYLAVYLNNAEKSLCRLDEDEVTLNELADRLAADDDDSHPQ